MNVADSERKLERLNWLISWAAAFLVFFVVSMTALMLWQAFRLGETSAEVKVVAVQTHDSLCALKLDIQHRHDSTQEYLKHHKGHLILGITRETFEKSLRDQESTLDSLSVLDCS